MKRRIIRPAIVELDLAELADSVGRSDPNVGLRFLAAVEDAFQKLAEMPEMGGAWESTNPRLAGLRVWTVRGFENYLILYRPIRDGIAVVRVLHGARDIEAILGA